MTWLTIQVLFTPKTKLSYRDRLDQVWSMMKTSHDNDVTNRIGLVYAKNNIELSGPIEPSVVYDETIQDNDVTDLPRAV